MHELSITESMLSLALDEAKKGKSKKITKINLVIGEMTGVVPDSVDFYFQFLSKNTIADGAVLAFNLIPIKTHCQNCGLEFTLEEGKWFCPACQNTNLTIIAGNELFVESIEVD